MKHLVNSYLAIAWKELLHIVRDSRTLFILFGMPVALVLIFGYTITNEFRNASIAVVNKSHDNLSRELIDHLTASGHFRLTSEVASEKALEDLFRSGDVKMGVIIPPDFEVNFIGRGNVEVQLLTDATEPNYAATLNSYATQMIATFNKNQLAGQVQGAGVGINVRMFYNPQLISAYYFIPGVVALILMLICAMMTSLTLTREKESGTMDLLLVSPLPPILIILGKVTPYVVLSFVDALVVLGMGYYIFDVPIRGSLALLLLLCLVYLTVALTLGVLISTRAKTMQTAMIASMFALLLPTMLLSGFIFPIKSMPLLLQYLSTIIPAKYFIDIEKAIMLRGVGWEYVTMPSLILVVMFFVLLVAARKNFKVIYR